LEFGIFPLMQRKNWFVFLLIVQCILLFIAFYDAFVHSGDYMFLNRADGFKNYHTFHAYLNQANSAGWWKFEQMNYPFGDYIFFTDNTPLLALIVKFFSRYIYDISAHGILIINWFCIFSVLLSTVLCWKILSKFIRHEWMIFLFSLCFVWLNPQLMRLAAGHYNLSFSWLILLTFWWLIRLVETPPNERKKRIRYSIYLFLTIVCGAFLHLYYAMLLSVIVGGFFLAWAFSKRKNRKSVALYLVWGTGIAAAALGAVLGIIRAIDGYYPIRKATPEGYDYGLWRLNFRALFTERDWNTIKFSLGTGGYFDHESGVYFGGFCAFGITVLLLMFLLRSREWISLKSIFPKNKQTQILAFIAFAGLLSLSIAWGERHHLFGSKHIVFYNIFNPFLYIGLVTDTVQQFRCLGRFSWVFYWSVSFGLLYILQHYWEEKKRWTRTLVIILTIFALIDTVDVIGFQHRTHTPNILTNDQHLSEVKDLAQYIQAADYQAILPLPFFHSGSEDYDYTIDPPEDFYRFSIQLSQVTALPCMGSRMSRTPPAHPKAFFSIFLDEKLDERLRRKLNDKPILTLVHKAYVTDTSWLSLQGKEPATSVVHSFSNTTKKHNMILIYENEKYELYRWEID